MPLLAADKLRLIITGECNLSCFYCHNEGQSEKRFLISESVVCGICEILGHAQVPVREVTISGGEPTLHPQLIRIVSNARLLTDNVTMVTNGLTIDLSMLDQLNVAGVRKLRLGIDSLRDGKSRPSPGINAPELPPGKLLSEALTSGMRVDINTVLTRFNAREISDIACFAIRHGTNIKFFEHVDVRSFSSSVEPGRMQSQPHVSLEYFLDQLAGIGDIQELPVDPAFGLANLRYSVGGIEVRYCRYLCPYGLCWTTGTRLDPGSLVYNCMLNRGADRLSLRQSPEQVLQSLGRASGRKCDFRNRPALSS